MDGTQHISFNETEHLFFGELVLFVFHITSIAMLSFGRNQFEGPKDNFLLEGLEGASDQVIQFYPTELLLSLKLSKLPKTIEADTYPITPNLETRLFSQPIEGPKTQSIQYNMVLPLFITFYEKGQMYVPKFGRSGKWSDDSAWHFGKVIRNSFVHCDGRICLDRGRPVRWKNISYTEDSTRARPAFLFKDLSTADLIFLMLEMNSELVRMAKPPDHDESD